MLNRFPHSLMHHCAALLTLGMLVTLTLIPVAAQTNNTVHWGKLGSTTAVSSCSTTRMQRLPALA
jgi:hypothetical protein